MSSGLHASSSYTPNFRPIFEKALEEYKKKTGRDLTTHPLAAEIKGSHSPEAILAVLEGKANELNQSRSSDERLTKWLNPTVNILNALSATLGEGVGSVFPPTKIIFSGIGVLLVAAKSTAANRDLLVKLFGRIESFFERLKIYTNVSPSPAVVGELAKIMAEVLSILGIATKGIKDSRTKIFLKKVAGMNDLEDALLRFGELEQRELLTGIAQVTSDTSILKDDAKETKAMVNEIADKIDARDWKEMLQNLKGWLSPPDPSTNYAVGLRDLHEETATWFLEGRIFQEWHSTGSLLWIHGKPGSGKSILCSTIIQRIISLCDDGRASVAYFYFDFRDDNKKHRHNLLPSLLVQLAEHWIPCGNIISRVYSAHGKGTQPPSDEVLTNCLTNMLTVSTQHPIYIIVDALDECPDTSGVRSPRERVLSFIKRLVDLRLQNLHICVTSRPEIDIRVRLEPLTPLRVSLHDQTGHKEDIAKYISSEVDIIAKDKRWREDDKEIIIATLSEKADGMFRWVFCQLEMLRLCLRSRVRHFVNELPDSLDETYERVLKGIHKTNRGYAQRLLQCLAVANRPLRIDELTEILTFDLDAIDEEVPTSADDWQSMDQEQEILSACPSLISIADSDRSRVVQFSHFSVKEFLTSDRLATSSEDISHYRIIPDAAHTTLAQASLGALLRLDDRANRWSVGNVSSRVLDEMKTLFDSDKPHFAAWLRIFNIDEPSSSRYSRWDTATPLYYSALCGFFDLVEHLVKKHSQHVNAIGGKHDYPLVAALHGGHVRIAELLFRHGANVGAQGTGGRTLLHTAIQAPSNLAVGAVQFLLKHGADINAREMDLSTPLHLAAAQGHFEVAQMLLQRGADANSRNADGETPLHMVPKPTFPRGEGNRAKLVQLLLENGADVNARNDDDETPLHLASYFPEPKLVQILLDYGASVNAEDSRGQIPLHQVLEAEDCSDEDRFGVAHLLMKHGADVNAPDEDDETPLHLASYFPELKLVRTLLDHGANVNAEGNWSRTPLHRVLEAEDYSDEDRFAVVQLFVERGADVNARDEDDETPLHLASYFPELNLVQILLDHGADVNAEDNQGRTPLHQALEDRYNSDEDHFGVAQLLAGRGADVNARDKDGRRNATTLGLLHSRTRVGADAPRPWCECQRGGQPGPDPLASSVGP
ncbi:ankyrin repeat-containing domain protein [Lactarius sanguifluus]|nr:ankyrin repeat-containing domain protein [Lactarius sanguifluus]